MRVGIPAVLMRGGTSKGLYFERADLPVDRGERDQFLLAAMGSPDPRQIDGAGGANSLTRRAPARRSRCLVALSGAEPNAPGPRCDRRGLRCRRRRGAGYRGVGGCPDRHGVEAPRRGRRAPGRTARSLPRHPSCGRWHRSDLGRSRAHGTTHLRRQDLGPAQCARARAGRRRTNRRRRGLSCRVPNQRRHEARQREPKFLPYGLRLRPAGHVVPFLGAQASICLRQITRPTLPA